MHYFYILKNPQGKYYVGVTKNISTRLSRHNKGRGSKFTSDEGKNFQLAYSEQYKTLQQAVQREKQIKKWSRVKKEALIIGDLDKLKLLSKSR